MERRAITIEGIVQGVGFRPFVFNLATRLELGGFVKNQAGMVRIEVEGSHDSLETFLAELRNHPPPLSHIEQVDWQPQAVRGEKHFRIDDSDLAHDSPIFIAPDLACCADCIGELYDPTNRRYRYPFVNCTNCGPRLTIIQGAPYDRGRTTMAGFAMCPACEAEYHDPKNRRFHAQATCCPTCGPRLRLLDARGREIVTEDPVAEFARGLLVGRIGAMKGLGGYHLVCAATCDEAVQELRRRKHRDEKPFAILTGDLERARTLCEISSQEQELLLSPRRPIVLLPKRVVPVAGFARIQVNRATGDNLNSGESSYQSLHGSESSRTDECETPSQIAEDVAPGNPFLGIMLPYTPLHHLLMEAVRQVPLVMTSGNRSDEPIAYADDDALARLGDIADLFLVNDRPIHVRCDDSVTRVVAGQEMPIRRARGHAPMPITLPVPCPVPILAVGGQLKGTFALGRDRHAFLSHHLGDLDHYEAFRAFEKDILLYEQLFAIQPELIVHDLHPDYAATRYARQRSARVLAVQHHHAHLASCMAENGLTGPVIGVTWDGTGYGTDGTIWGGEFLVGDYRQFRRAGHLRNAGMPGGDQAIREPWRMAAAHLRDAGADLGILEPLIDPASLHTVLTMLERGFNCPLTSSAGRLFDAVAAIVGVRQRVSHEGQAAVELEWLAMQSTAEGAYPVELAAANDTMVIDTRPLIRAVVRDVRHGESATTIARRFHTTMVEVIASVCGRIRRDTSLEDVVLSGGVFLNALLTEETSVHLRAEGFRVHRHRRVPPNDGGLSLGQLAIACARYAE